MPVFIELTPNPGPQMRQKTVIWFVSCGIVVGGGETVSSISRYDPKHVEAGRRSPRAKTTYENRRGGRRHRCGLGDPLFHVTVPHPLA